MPDLVSLTAVTPRFALPQLFSAQAQKEFVVNESLARLDLLLHCTVEGEADAPPSAPLEGQCWLVGAAPAGAWLERPGAIAGFQAGTWLFAEPVDGLHLFDRSTRQNLLFDGTWQRIAPPAAPTGGATVDAEAREAIGNLIVSLRNAGIFPAAE